MAESEDGALVGLGVGGGGGGGGVQDGEKKGENEWMEHEHEIK